MVTLLLLFCVAILINMGVVFVCLFVGFFVAGIVVVFKFFVGITVGIFRSSLY